MAPTDLKAWKRKLSPELLALPGVSGVGVGKDALRVYLAEDSQKVRQRVFRAVEQAAPELAVSFEVTGPFKAG